MTNEQLEALQAPNAVKNTSIPMVKQFLFPQLVALSLSPIGVFVEATGIMHANGSGPGGTFTEDELKAMGVPADFAMYVQYTIAGYNDANGPMLFDAADDVRIFEGYDSDATTEPDPNFWYVDRVRRFYEENFNAPPGAADNAMLNIPRVRQTVQDVLEAATSAVAMPTMTIKNVTSTTAEAPPAPAPIDAEFIGQPTPVVPEAEPTEKIIGILYAGPASEETINVMASALGSAARGMSHVILEPAKTLYLARVPDNGTAASILAKLQATYYGSLFSLAELIRDEHIEAAIRAGGPIPMLTA